MKKLLSLLLLCALLVSLSACTDPVIGGTPAEPPIEDNPAEAPEAVIELNGDSIRYKGRGAVANGSVITIGAPGSYTVRGTLRDGRIIIDLKETPGKVTLFLDGADITCLTDSAIYLIQADELNLVLGAGSSNRVVSGTEADLAAYNETRQGAAIFCEDDLDIQGSGELTVFGYLNNGIGCKDDIKIKEGSLTVLAANNAIRASESVTVSGGTVRTQSGNDGIKTSSAKKADKGFVLIENGNITVLSGGDGISAESLLTISGGRISVTADGDPSAVSCKGLKGKTGVVISGGTIDVTASDHALRSGAALTVSGGELALRSTAGKGLAAETEILISDGSLAVVSSDDGLSSADTVRITGGSVLVQSGADGLQGGKSSTGFTAAAGTVSIEGGQVLVSAFHKPIDAKASFVLTGGTVFVCGSSIVPPQSAIPCAQYAVEGRAGTELTMKLEGAPALTSAYLFSAVLYASADLSAGQRCTLQNGSQTLEAEAK